MTLILIIMCMIMLITMPEICIEGARNGLLLWFETILPTLFPFFIISRLIIELKLCPRKLLPFYPIFVGLLSGYPTGALTISSMYSQKQLSKHTAENLLVLCNNASPAFLISYVACTKLHLTNSYIIWISVVGSSALICILFCLFNKSDTKNTCTHKNPAEYSAGLLNLKLFENIIMKSFEILLLIGGYVIIFSLLANVILSLPFNKNISTILSGICEITTGINLITSKTCTLNYELKCIFSSAICGFGGMSALIQTYSGIKESGLSLKKYLFQRILCALLSGLICFILLH